VLDEYLRRQDGVLTLAQARRAGLSQEAVNRRWKTNYPVGGYKIDVAFPKQKVAIEVDGLAFHSDGEVFHSDRKRQNAISLLGWKVLRFTWLDLTEYPQRVMPRSSSQSAGADAYDPGKSHDHPHRERDPEEHHRNRAQRKPAGFDSARVRR
jgi:very-short-patch-repair endonuclease